MHVRWRGIIEIGEEEGDDGWRCRDTAHLACLCAYVRECVLSLRRSATTNLLIATAMRHHCNCLRRRMIECVSVCHFPFSTMPAAVELTFHFL